MAKTSTLEKMIFASIKKLGSRKSKIQEIVNARPVSDLITLQKEANDFLDQNRTDGKFNKSFFEIDNKEIISKKLNEFTQREKSIFKIIESQKNSTKLFDELLEIESELSDLQSEMYFIELRKTKKL